MVYFKGNSSHSDERHLVILDDQHQPVEKGTILVVYTPLVGGDAKWDGDLQFTGDFHYTKGYWEWTEDVLSRCGKRLRLISAYDAVYASLFTYDHNSDIIKAFCEAWCPLTNTLLTSAGELSISLWNLHNLAGLPITGCFNDEVVPSVLELTSADEKALFEKLCIEGNLKEEVYLAAYLACWLYTFVLPDKDFNSIRPSTFNMASMMASGRRVSLAIPILASIYEGLNIIATSSRPARTSLSFPVHFVYAWLAFYFKTHYPVWQGLRGPKMIRFSGEGGAKPFKFVDNNEAEELEYNYFVAICSSYLLSVKLEDEIQSIDASEESETSHSWTTTPPPPFGMGFKGKQLSQPPVVSVLEGESFLFSHHKEFLQKMWSDLLMKISNTPVDFLSSIEDDVSLILESMKNFYKFDITKEAKTHLQDVQAKASEGASKVQSIVDELEHVEKEIVALKGQRMSLCAALKEQNNSTMMLKPKFMRSRKTLQHLIILPHLMMQ
ncbi:UNVERIFIED_CONTAM: hypothetical protein Slati_0485900 [Sesamum latifolium]|uniref:Aminotransferase-like plant mobile domain-containing protein n=1 Tax=Sesamum latifolium TaxID=2727402 RepID=A0AAW2XX55_9LAMI